MRILISIEHPAWVHQFKYIIKKLEKRGHIVKVVAINKDRDLELLDAFNIKYDVISNTIGKNLLENCFVFLQTTWKILLISIKFKPNLFLGRASPMMAINSFLFRKKHIVFEDVDIFSPYLFICKLFSTIIITPFLFSRDLGKKHLRVHTYKELFYLHPEYFKPDSSILDEMGLNRNEIFVLLRFVSFEALHDISREGFKLEDKRKLIKELEKYSRVFISSESSLPEDFEKYMLRLSPEKIHDFIYYAKLFICDSGTMATEAAILGTPVIRCNSLVGKKDLSNFCELENKYGLLVNIRNPKKAIKKAEEMIQKTNLKREWQDKRKRLLEDKYNINNFIIWLIENYHTHS